MSLPRDLRSRLLTLLLLGLAAAGLYLWARREDLLSRPLPQSGPLYPGLDVPHIEWLHLGLRGGQDIELQRESSGAWWITQPSREFAHQDRVAVLLDNLARAQVRALEATAGPVSSKAVGLDPPAHVIAFRIGDRTETLTLGAVEPIGREVYARRTGEDHVVLATRNLVTLLDDNSSEWVDPALLRGVTGRVTGLLVDGPGGHLQAERSGDTWGLRTPDPVLADDDRIDQLIRTLQFVQVGRVITLAPGPAALHGAGLPTAEEAGRGQTAGATHLVLSTADLSAGAWLAAGWASATADVYVVRDDFAKIVTVKRESLNMLANSPEWFREHHLLPPVRERAESLRLERAGEVVLDIRHGTASSWSFFAPARLAGETVESERIEGHSSLGDFLGRIDALGALAFAAPPGGEPVARLSVGWKFTGVDRLDRVDLFQAGDRLLAVTTERPGEALELPATALDLFAPLVPETLRSLRPFAFDWARCQHVLIEHPEGPPLEIRREAGGQWTGDDEWTRRTALGFDLVRGLRGFKWVAARPGAAYPWRVRFEDGQGALLGEVRLRLTEGDESPETFGFPTAVAAITGRDGVELLVSKDWLQRLVDLAGPLVRKP
jgi:Domain of unknown function (DUF4340)